jgi:hypothetical protein
MNLKDKVLKSGRCKLRRVSTPVLTTRGSLRWLRKTFGVIIFGITLFLLLVSVSQAQTIVNSAQDSYVSSSKHFAGKPTDSPVCCPSDCEPVPQFPNSIFAKIGEALWRPIRQIGTDYTRNRIWPEPYATMDRVTIPPAYFQMVAKGWQQQTLLGDPHFVVSQDHLSEAGKAKVRWIAQAVPSERRVIFVHSPDPGIGAKRQEAVRRYLESLQLDGSPPPIILTPVEPRWASGAELGLIHQKFQESTPNPRLPMYQPYQVQSP